MDSRPHSILFVCTGNQCRSPVAARLLQKAIQTAMVNPDSAPPIGAVESAGVWAKAGSRPPSLLSKVALASEIDLRTHRAQSIEQINDLAEYDLILTMERTQCESLRVEFPQLASRIHLLTALVGPPYDVSDPMGGTEEDYQSMIEELRQLIARVLPEIVKLATQPVYAQD